GDLLVGQGRDVPEPRGMHVEGVERIRQQGEQQAERACEEKSSEDVCGARTGRQAVRDVVEERPPEERTREEVARMLHGEQRARVAESRVIHDGDVPDGVGPEPERQRDERVGERPDRAQCRKGARHRRAQSEDGEARGPLRERDVLEQVRREQVVLGKRRGRADEHAEREDYPGGEGDDTGPARAVAARRATTTCSAPRARTSSAEAAATTSSRAPAGTTSSAAGAGTTRSRATPAPTG